MEEKSAFGKFAKWFIGSLYGFWVVVALTILGALIGVLINMVIDNDQFIPAIIYTGALLGFIGGLFFARSRLRDDFL